MKKNTNIKTNHGFIILIAFILLFGIILYAATNVNKTYTPQTNTLINTSDTKTYSSESMKFSVGVPTKFKVNEKFFRVTLASNEGNIYIEKNGTNFDNIDDYVNELDTKNNSVTLDKERLSINSFPTISGMVGNQKYYFIYADNWTIFTLFSNSSSLFPVLDQIASSFRYTP